MMIMVTLLYPLYSAVFQSSIQYSSSVMGTPLSSEFVTIFKNLLGNGGGGSVFHRACVHCGQQITKTARVITSSYEIIQYNGQNLP